jgi:glycosyltransferase involved in cell wall biosynthesis
MRFGFFHAGLRNAGALLIVLLSNPRVTWRLITWTRIKNAFRVILLRQGNWTLLLQRYRSILNVTSAKKESAALRISGGHKPDILFFPAIDWGFRFQRPQHLARELGALGYRVFYVSTVPLLVSGRTDYLIQGNPEPGVILVQLSSGSIRIPDFYRDELRPHEVAGLLRSCEALQQDFGIKKFTLVVQQPFWWPLVAHMGQGRLVYDCLDHHAGFVADPSPTLIEIERELIDAADAVVATSAALAESVLKTRECQLIRNACEYARFSRVVRVKSSSRPIVGYVGAVSEWFDGQLLFDVANARSEWQFDIYGAIVGANVAACRALPNVNFFGEISYESVPDVVAHFDVCIIPFKLNSLTFATNPVKVYEYLASGRPVIATTIPELANMENLDVLCADSASDFVSKIELMLKVADIPDRIICRQSFARHNDWSARASQLVHLIS